jgi:phosphoadenosine phosphosulfate reductase
MINSEMIDKADYYHKQFCEMRTEEILSTVIGMHPGKVAFSTSLGAEDQVITHLVSLLKLNVNIFTLDTGRMFSETYDVLTKTNARYGINIRIYFPDASSVEEMVNSRGINLFYESIENRKLCCNIRKIEPLKRALKGYEVWITGLRREQSPTRNNMKFAEWDPGNGIIKLNPLLEWTEQEIWSYIKKYNIPYNTLHDRGFPSIGCQPCTRAVMPGEDIRSGRWWWEHPDTKECGLHPLGRNKVVK